MDENTNEITSDDSKDIAKKILLTIGGQLVVTGVSLGAGMITAHFLNRAIEKCLDETPDQTPNAE